MAAKAVRARYKLLASMFTTYGYAVMGASIITPLLSTDQHITLPRIGGIVAALAFQGMALYVAPKGEPA